MTLSFGRATRFVQIGRGFANHRNADRLDEHERGGGLVAPEHGLRVTRQRGTNRGTRGAGVIGGLQHRDRNVGAGGASARRCRGRCAPSGATPIGATASSGDAAIRDDESESETIMSRLCVREPSRTAWRECMGIEPTQPDVVRSRTVLKTVRATRLHPLPSRASRKHETVALRAE